MRVGRQRAGGDDAWWEMVRGRMMRGEMWCVAENDASGGMMRDGLMYGGMWCAAGRDTWREMLLGGRV